MARLSLVSTHSGSVVSTLNVCVYCSTYYKAVRAECVFISTYVCVYYCSTYYKAVREGGGGGMEDMCYERLRAKAGVN